MRLTARSGLPLFWGASPPRPPVSGLSLRPPALVRPLTSLLLGLAIALFVSQAAALYPAWKGSRVNIVEAIKHE